MESSGKITSVLMFPWLAHGHLSPFLELAKRLSHRNFIVYLCSTPANFASIKQKRAETSYSRIEFVEIQLPTMPNLPPSCHTTNGLPPHLMPVLKEAFDLSCPTFVEILKEIKPDLLIYDCLQSWAASAALKMNIPAVLFISSSITMFTYTFHHCNKPPSDEYPFSKSIYLRPYETSYACKLKNSAANGDKVKNRGRDSLELSCKIVLFKSFKEIEGEYMDYFTRLTGKTLVPLGPLAQEPLGVDENSKIIEWLNKKDRASTIFVSFGSEYFLSDDDMKEIALGLELSNVNFIWIVRFPIDSEASIEDKLPGFLERVGDRGLVEKWAPQASILKHANIGGFVSHCGWSSVLEAMTYGVPIIAMPMHLDQPINARLVCCEAVGVGKEVVRSNNGKLEGHVVANVIKEVIEEKTGENIRKKAQELRDKVKANGDQEIDVVAEELKKICNLLK